jgi:hypothetical protein
MLIAAAVCPHPPLLVPEMAGAAAGELDDLRAAALQAVRGLLAADPAVLVVVGEGAVTRRYPAESAGSMRPYGLDLTFGSGPAVLPLALTVGRWLLAQAGGEAAAFQAVGDGTTPGGCLELGRELAGSAGRVGLLVMGDGSACRDEKAPGYFDPAAEGFDASVAGALENADAAALAALDPVKARDLQAAGRAAWQVLAGAVGPQDRFKAALLADQAPYGVGYFVASWLR